MDPGLHTIILRRDDRAAHRQPWERPPTRKEITHGGLFPPHLVPNPGGQSEVAEEHYPVQGLEPLVNLHPQFHPTALFSLRRPFAEKIQPIESNILVALLRTDSLPFYSLRCLQRERQPRSLVSSPPDGDPPASPESPSITSPARACSGTSLSV